MIPLRFVFVVILFNFISTSLVTAYPLEVSPTKIWDSTKKVVEVFVHNNGNQLPNKWKSNASNKKLAVQSINDLLKQEPRLNEVFKENKINVFSATDLLFGLPSLTDILQNNNKKAGVASISKTVAFFSNWLLDNENSKAAIQEYVIPFIIATFILSPITSTQALMITFMYNFTKI